VNVGDCQRGDVYENVEAH